MTVRIDAAYSADIALWKMDAFLLPFCVRRA